ncbi:MAG: hypothetical protein WA821_02415 [Anaerolineales bacterium]
MLLFGGLSRVSRIKVRRLVAGRRYRQDRLIETGESHIDRAPTARKTRLKGASYPSARPDVETIRAANEFAKNECHADLKKDWKTPAGQALAQEWIKLVGNADG